MHGYAKALQCFKYSQNSARDFAAREMQRKRLFGKGCVHITNSKQLKHLIPVTAEEMAPSRRTGADGRGRPDWKFWMKTRLTPHYISLVYEACLKSFWRRKALAKFLRQCDVSESFLQSWAPDESKRDVLDRLFLKLPKSDSGRSGLVKMAGFLMEQESFPDLKNWEDSAAKLKAAHDAVSQLRHYHSKQQKEIQSEEDKVEARKEVRRATASGDPVPQDSPRPQ